jgi:hypothetical protein
MFFWLLPSNQSTCCPGQAKRAQGPHDCHGSTGSLAEHSLNAVQVPDLRFTPSGTAFVGFRCLA